MIAQVIPLFSVIFFGAIAYRIGFRDEQFSKNLNTFVFYFALPCFIFHEFINLDQSQDFPWSYFVAFGLSSFITMALSYLVLGKVENKSETWLRTFATVHSNAGYLGIPFSIAVFNTSLPAIVVILFQVLIFTPTQLTMLSYLRSNNGSILKTIFKNPILSAAIIGAIISFLHIPSPKVVDESLNFLGRSAMPLALFSLGLFMGSQIKTMLNFRASVYMVVLFKNMVHPLVAYLLGKYVFHLDQVMLQSIIVMASMPTAVNNFIFAREYQAFERDSGAVIVYTTLVFMILSFAFAYFFKI